MTMGHGAMAARGAVLPVRPAAFGSGLPALPVLTVTDVRQYFYCPRVVFYRLCQPLRRPVTYKMQEGKLAQDRTADLEHRRTLQAYGLGAGERHFNVDLCSPALGLRGIVDMVIVTGDEAIPVEFKNTSRAPARNHAYQLAAYSLLVEERWARRGRKRLLRHRARPRAVAVEQPRIAVPDAIGCPR